MAKHSFFVKNTIFSEELNSYLPIAGFNSKNFNLIFVSEVQLDQIMTPYTINYTEALLCLARGLMAAYKSCVAMCCLISPSGYSFRISSKDFIK